MPRHGYTRYIQSRQSSVLFVFLLSGRSWAGFSTHGRHHRNWTHLSRDSTAYCPRDTVSTGHKGTGFFNDGIPWAVLRGSQQPWDTTGRDSIIMGLHGMFCARFSNHGTPQQYCIPAYSARPNRWYTSPCRQCIACTRVYIFTAAAMLHCTSRLGAMQNRAARTNTLGRVVVVVVLILTHHCH